MNPPARELPSKYRSTASASNHGRHIPLVRDSTRGTCCQIAPTGLKMNSGVITMLGSFPLSRLSSWLIPRNRSVGGIFIRMVVGLFLLPVGLKLVWGANKI